MTLRFRSLTKSTRDRFQLTRLQRSITSRAALKKLRQKVEELEFITKAFSKTQLLNLKRKRVRNSQKVFTRTLSKRDTTKEEKTFIVKWLYQGPHPKIS